MTTLAERAAALLALADAATPGPWLYRGKSNSLHKAPPPNTTYRYGDFIVTVGSDDRDESEADIDFIAAAHDMAALIRELLAENAELESEAEEGDALRQKMSKMLDDTANALRGQPQELHRWSWHDLPERAAAAIAAIDVMTRAARENAAEVERLRARVAELESGLHNIVSHWLEVGGPMATRGAIFAIARRSLGDAMPTAAAVDAGPTPFQGRTTRRNEN